MDDLHSADDDIACPASPFPSNLSITTTSLAVNVQVSEQERISEIQKIDMTVIALSETNKKRSRIEEMGNYIHFFSGVRKEHKAKRGISILIKKNIKVA
ncbi:hypothetical protein HUJ04_004717 [Dendroctonus ponderosae]|nr:hypothetical protein HUJ04_004717 [Dendroctonus ponderosae]KAH1015000.1 hypothetical protein HUJ05_012788 [Dendroctonus ponderosae]